MNAEPTGDALSSASDRVLVGLVLAERSELAFRALHRRHGPRLYSVALRMLGNGQDAEDVVQETWLRGIAQLKEFAWRSTLGTWLMAIAMNTCRNVLEKRGRWLTIELEDDAVHVESESQSIDLDRAIALLPPARRAAFILHDVHGFTHEEIAAQMGYAAGTSKAHVFRARRMLRRLLGEIPTGGTICGTG